MMISSSNGTAMTQDMRDLEAELQASAAGYPGANEDLITYVRFSLLKSRQGGSSGNINVEFSLPTDTLEK